MQTREEIWTEFYKNWVAEDGLARLVSKEKELIAYGRPFYNGLGQETVYNANGILFLSYALLVLHALGGRPATSKYCFRTIETIEKLVRQPYRGLFDRWAKDPKDRTKGPSEHERHDNYAAIASLSALYGLKYTREILEYGKKTLWHYDNIAPEKPRDLLSREDWANQRQLGEVAFYYACNGEMPGPIKSLWMLVGLLINAFKKGEAGETNLAWLRLYALLKVAKTGFILKAGARIVSWVWKARKNKEWKGLQGSITQYFTHEHPLSALAKLLGPNKWGF